MSRLLPYLSSLLAAIVLLTGCQRQPEARGKKLDEWLTLLKHSNNVAELRETCAALTELGPHAGPAAWELARLLADRQAFGHYRSFSEPQVAEVYGYLSDALRAIGPAAAKVVLQSFEFNRPVSADVMRALSPAAVAELLPGFEHPNLKVRRGLAERWRDLGPAGQVGAPALIKALTDDDPMVRKEAAKSLGSINAAATATVPALLTAATDAVPVVRLAAVESLGSFPDAAASIRPALASRLGDVDSAVADAAVASLIKLAGSKPETVAILLPELTGAQRVRAMRALLGMDALALLPADLLATFIESDNAEFAVPAMTALLAVNPRAALFVPALVGRLRERSDVFTAPRQDALAAIGAPAVPALTRLLAYRDEPAAEAEVVRYEAAMGLAAIGAPAKPALPVLEGMVETESSEHVRTAVIEAIRRIKSGATWSPKRR